MSKYQRTGNKYYLLHKPFGMLSQFTPEGKRDGLSSLGIFEKDVYPVGRLDAESEGLLLLSSDGSLTHQILGSEQQVTKTYWVQLEGEINDAAIAELERGVDIKVNKSTYHTLPAQVSRLHEPKVPDRNPPVRYRASIPTSWISISIVEGKNRQIRKMCAAVGFPCLRLIRQAIGRVALGDIAAGDVMEIDKNTLLAKLKAK